MDRIIVNKEVFPLNTVDGLRPGTVSFRTLSMESDKFACVRDVQPDKQPSLVVVDTERRISERHNIKDAEAAIMNPDSRILALRSGRQLQVFNIEIKDRILGHTMEEDVVFWRWLDATTIALVTTSSVYHWKTESGSNTPPEKMFDRNDPSIKILNYKTDDVKQWLMLNGCSQGANVLEGKTQLYSVSRNASVNLDGFAGTFVRMPTNLDPSPNNNILCLASGSNLLIKELPTAEKTDREKMINLNNAITGTTGPVDFPVVMHVTPHKLLMIITSQGNLLLHDVLTGASLHTEKVSANTVFAGVAHRSTGGVQCANNNGSIFSVSIDNFSIVPFLKNTLGNVDLALRVAGNAGLGGVDDLFKAQLVDLIRKRDAAGAIKVCIQAPRNLLRTSQVLRQFKDMPVTPGQQSVPMSLYFREMLNIGKLNECESVELARISCGKAGNADYVKTQITADKFTLSSDLGEVVEPLDADLALRVYIKAESHPKVLKVLFARGDIPKAIEYCKRVDYKPEWRSEVAKFIQSNPEQAVGFVLALHRDMGHTPVLDPLEVVDMFVSQQQIRNATQFLMDILSSSSGDNTAALQTKLLEINLKHSPPSVAEKIFGRNLYSNYDGMTLAVLCERASLFQRAIECYIKAQYQNSDLDNLSNIRRCLSKSERFNGEWLIDFFGKLSQNDSRLCLSDLLAHHEQHFSVIVQVAIKYTDALGTDTLIEMFLDKNLYEMLFAYLGAIVAFTRDPEVHFRYIEAALKVGNNDEVERMTRESPCYDPERTKTLIKNPKLSNLWPFINVCDKHDFIDEMVRFLLETDNQALLEQYVQRRNPIKTPEVVASLLDCSADEAYIKTVLNAAGTICPIGELVDQVESRGRLKILLPWLEARKAERKTDVALYNALGKIYVDTNNNPEEYLSTNEYYDAVVMGKYCENRNTNLAYIAYKRAQKDDEIVELTIRNGMWKDMARYLVKRQDATLWDTVLKRDGRERTHLVEAVQQTALPESKVVEEVITCVKAFLSANMNNELTSILDQIVLHGEFRNNRHLENLLIISATKARPDKVMEYVNNLTNYDAEDIANIATGAGLHEVAFTVYDKHDMKKMAVTALLHDLKDLPRGRAYVQKTDLGPVWTVLAVYLLKENEVHEAIDALIKAKNPDFVKEVSEACERVNQYGDLIKYLMMARKESKNKNHQVDTYLVLTYAKTGRLTELETFLKEARGVQVLTVADKCFADGLYDSARVLYEVGSNFPKLASTLVRLGNLSEAVAAAEKAKNVKTWKEVNRACLEDGSFDLAKACAVHIVLRAEELNEIVALYETAGYWEEVAAVLKSSTNQNAAHMGIFTELGVLYACYQPEKLMEHVNMFPKKINTHRLITVCEEYHHWNSLRVLYVNNEDWLAASQTMMNHPSCWDHEVFKDVVSYLGSSDILYNGILFYIEYHPDLLLNYLVHIMKKVDPERVMLMVQKVSPIHIIRSYLESVQERNIKKVNETLNDLYVDEESFSAIRKSVDQHNNFDSVNLSCRLEKMELFEFRKIALELHRRNKRYSHALQVAKSNTLYQEAIETAAESGDGALVSELMDFFIAEKLEECFAACLYTCYDQIPPHVAMEKAWRAKMMDSAMPFMLQTMQNYSTRLERLEKNLEESTKSQSKNDGRQNGQTLLLQNNYLNK